MSRFRYCLVYGALGVASLIIVYPFFFMVINSFKPVDEIIHASGGLPSEWSLGAYIELWKNVAFGRVFLNTLFVSLAVTVLNTLFSSMVAYAIVKTGMPGREFWLKLIVSSMMVPGMLLMVPVYMMLYDWGWVNTYRALIIPSSVSAYNIFLLTQFMRQIDDSYLEVARLDGVGELRIFFRVILPMMRPALTTVAVLSFLGVWNDIVAPLLYIRDNSMLTLQLALYRFQSEVPTAGLGQLWAMATLSVVPIVFVFLFLQRNFIIAFTGVGLKQ